MFAVNWPLNLWHAIGSLTLFEAGKTKFSVATKVGGAWEFAVVIVDCSEDHFTLLTNDGKPYNVRAWEHHHFFMLLEGVLPVAE